MQADSKKPHLTPDRDGGGFHKRSSYHDDERKRRYRDHRDDTPSHGGGVNTSAKFAIDDRNHKSRRVDYSSSKEKDRRKDYSRDDEYRKRGRDGEYNRDRDRNKPGYRGQDRERDHRRDREQRDERGRDNNRSHRSSSLSSREEERRHTSRSEGSVRFRDEPLTPALSLASTPGRKAWDDDDSGYASKRSSQWDFPTPGPEGRPKRDEETPLPTPIHKFNPWVRQPGSSHILQTPSFVKDKINDDTGDNEVQVDREDWEDEQKRLDREWYNMDEGYDEVHNPFAGISDDYTKKKEEQMAQKKHQRMSAQQRQINRDNELWEKNRLLTSGVVMNVDGSEDYEEESEARVHLLVHNIVPPFLDGRIVFTKQYEPVVPVRVSN